MMTKTNEYADMTDEDFDEILRGICDDVGTDELLDIPGVYELVREHYNNDVLAEWKAEQEEEDEEPDDEDEEEE